MATFQESFKPVALPDQVVKLLPDEELREVRAVEPMMGITSIDFGPLSAGGKNGPDGNEVTELTMDTNHLGQFRMSVLSPVEIQVNQDGKQDQRFTNSNTRGTITPTTPLHLAELFVFQDGLPFFIIENPNTYALERTLVSFQGFKLILEPDELSEEDLGRRQPIGVPIDRLEVTTQRQRGGGGGGRATQGTQSRRAD